MPAAQQCVPVNSSWIDLAILMCDDTLSVLFKNGFCCNYPRTTQAHFDALITAPSAGHWLRTNLYRILPYQVIPLPCPPAGCGVQTTCCPNALPMTLHATADNGIGSVPMVWDGSTYWLATGL